MSREIVKILTRVISLHKLNIAIWKWPIKVTNLFVVR